MELAFPAGNDLADSESLGRALDMIAGVEHGHSRPMDAAEVAADAGAMTGCNSPCEEARKWS